MSVVPRLYFLILFLLIPLHSWAQVTLPSGLVINEWQIKKLNELLPRTEKELSFYHWTSPEIGARWVLQGGLDPGEVAFYSRPTGKLQAHGPGIYLAENSSSSSTFGAFPVKYYIPPQTLIYDKNIVAQVLGETLNNIDASALGEMIPFIRKVNTGSDWWLFTHPTLARKIQMPTDVAPTKAPDWGKALRELEHWGDPEVHTLSDWLTLARYQDGISFFRSNQTSDPFAQFEPQNFGVFKKTLVKILDPNGATQKGLNLISPDTKQAEAEAWVINQVKTVLPGIYNELGGIGSYRGEGVRGGGDEAGKTFVATRSQYRILESNPYLEVHKATIEGSKDLRVVYFYPDVFHYKKIQSRLSSDLLSELKSFSANELWINHELRNRLNQQLVEELLLEVFDRYKALLATGDIVSKPTELAQFLQELISIHPFDDFSGRSTRLYVHALISKFKGQAPYFFLSDLDLLTTPEQFGKIIKKSSEKFAKLEIAAVKAFLQAREQGLSSPDYTHLPEYYALGEGLDTMVQIEIRSLGRDQMEKVRKRQWVSLFDDLSNGSWRNSELFNELDEYLELTPYSSEQEKVLLKLQARFENLADSEVYHFLDTAFSLSPNPEEGRRLIRELVPHFKGNKESFIVSFLYRNLQEKEEFILKSFLFQHADLFKPDDLYFYLKNFKVSSSTLKELLPKIYATDGKILELTKLVGRDLSGWAEDFLGVTKSQAQSLPPENLAKHTMLSWLIEEIGKRDEDFQRATLFMLKKNSLLFQGDRLTKLYQIFHPDKSIELSPGIGFGYIEHARELPPTPIEIEELNDFFKFYPQSIPEDEMLNRTLDIMEQFDRDVQKAILHSLIFSKKRKLNVDLWILKRIGKDFFSMGFDHNEVLKELGLNPLKVWIEKALSNDTTTTSQALDYFSNFFRLRNESLTVSEMIQSWTLLKELFPEVQNIPDFLKSTAKDLPTAQKLSLVTHFRDSLSLPWGQNFHFEDIWAEVTRTKQISIFLENLQIPQNEWVSLFSKKLLLSPQTRMFFKDGTFRMDYPIFFRAILEKLQGTDKEFFMIDLATSLYPEERSKLLPWWKDELNFQFEKFNRIPSDDIEGITKFFKVQKLSPEFIRVLLIKWTYSTSPSVPNPDHLLNLLKVMDKDLLQTNQDLILRLLIEKFRPADEFIPLIIPYLKEIDISPEVLIYLKNSVESDKLRKWTEVFIKESVLTTLADEIIPPPERIISGVVQCLKKSPQKSRKKSKKISPKKSR